MSRYLIGNWPPGMPSTVDIADGYLKEIRDAQTALTAALDAADEWRKNQCTRKEKAWVAYHDEHGWPVDADYEKRLRAAVGKAAVTP